MKQRWKGWSLALLGLTLSIVLALSSCRASTDKVVDITLVHLNDIYEITAVEGGKRGGLARVATLRQDLLAHNSNTYTILAGDAFSPSALGTAKVNGQRLAGRQMVAVMNALGFDYATFGNHEFDLPKDQFLQRLQESRFQWFSSNVLNAKTGEAFAGVPSSIILRVEDEQGAVVRVGLIGVTLESNPADYVKYKNPIDSAREEVKELQGQVDILVAVTHLSLAEDQQLAAEVPEIDLILGGHEHENIQQWRIVSKPAQSAQCQENGTPIFKADANARTVYIHDLHYNTANRCLEIESRLQPITEAISEEPRTAKVVQEWVEQGFQAFRENGFEPTEVIATTTEPLDGLESSVRNYSTNLTKLIAEAMLREVGDADLAVFNSGSIRIDDRLPAGEITEYDVIRVLPFGGKVLSVQMQGDMLKKVLDVGQKNRGTGGYLQTANVEQEKETGSWLIQGQPLKLDLVYGVAINDFLVTGKEQNLGFLTREALGEESIIEKEDIRQAVIRELKARQSEPA
ncbi:MAG: bifunctional UDP-sugar hydrolase/5'-nucleotidase [Xenococcaceae cyanobacterium]